MTGLLEGRVIVVTGAGAGIGLGIARACVAEGATVLGATLRPEEAVAVTAAGAHFVEVDVARPESLEALWTGIVREHGRVDGLVSNAGLTIDRPFLEMDVEDLETLWRVNLRGTFLACRGAARIMASGGQGGAIVAVASNHARGSLPGFEMYAATKGGVVAMARAMAWSLGPLGIRVNSLSPGLTRTEAVAAWLDETPDLEAGLRSAHASGRFNGVDEVGRVAAFLLSPSASSITGADIVADQGASSRLGRL